MFGKFKKLGRNIATKVYSTLNPVVKGVKGTLAKAGKQPAAALAFPVASGTDLKSGQRANVARDQAVVPNRPGQTPIRMGPTVITVPSGFSVGKTGGLVKDPSITGLSGGDIANAEATGQAGPTNIYSQGSSRANGNSVIDFAPMPDTSIVSSQTLGGSTGGSGGSINLGSTGGAGLTGVAGALAGATTKNQTYSDGTPLETDEFGNVVKQKEKENSAQWFERQLQDAQDNRPSNEDLFAQSQKESGIMEARQQVNNWQSQLNVITAQAEADQLSVTGQGRGIPEPIILGQQNQIAKEAAIRALPIAAQLSAAQNNMELAQQHLDTLFKMRSQDAENKFNFRMKSLESIKDYLSAEEKKVWDRRVVEENRQYNEHQDFEKTRDALLKSATTQRAPSSIINAINSARTAQEAIAAAGQYGAQIPKATGGSGGETTTYSKGKLSNKQFVEISLQKAGIAYQDALGKVPAGKVGVVDNKTGQIGHIDFVEYNTRDYTLL